MNSKYRKVIYSNYDSVQFGQAHNLKDLSKEYKISFRYFQKNYLKYLPDRKDSKILDVGCGFGHFLYFLDKKFYKNYVGIDISKNMVNICKSHGFNALEENAFKYLQKFDCELDLIVLNDILEHFKKDEIMIFFDIVYKALKPNGKVIVKVPNMANPITGLAGRYIDFTHETGLTETSLHEVITSAKFDIIEIVGTDIYVFYGNPINYVAKFISYLISFVFYLLSYLFGRKSLKIFTKDLLGVAQKPSLGKR